jgi:hypothetical protein
MKTIDPTKLFIAGPGDQTVRFVRGIINHSVNSLAPPTIDDVSGIIVPRQVASDEVVIPAQNLNFPELIAQTRSEIPESTIICIMPAEDDAATIAKMIFHTYWKDQIQSNPAGAIATWPELAGQTSDPALCEAAFMSDVHSKCSPVAWIESDTSAADLVIDFKTVMGLDTKDLNQIICDFLQIPRQAELDTLIAQFRAANQQYIS